MNALLAHQEESLPPRVRRTEIIAIASGKGGTGKTLIGACLGYALIYSGLRVLMIDTDTATHGLSLYLLGPKGRDLQPTGSKSTWAAILEPQFMEDPSLVVPAVIRRDIGDEVDHGIKYEALISELGLYGDDLAVGVQVAPGRGRFSQAVTAFFAHLRLVNAYDYVLVDTRGGFSFETTDVCALADSFVVVTDADVTSFVQDRNLVKRINLSAGELGTKPLLRAIIVNRATDGEEKLFRTALAGEFPVTFGQTYPIPLDLDAFKAYKTQQCPYVMAPGSHFSYATLKAFGEIMSIVNAEWGDAQVARWNELSGRVSGAVEDRNARFAREIAERQEERNKFLSLSAQAEQQSARIEQLEREIHRTEAAHEREIQRVRELREFLGKSMKLVPLVTAVLLVAVGAFLYAEWRKDRSRAEAEDMLVKVYQPDGPPALRIRYLQQLYAGGNRSFDRLNLKGMDLAGLEVPGISFVGSDLESVNLAGADLSSANLSSASLVNANLSRASLRGANLNFADLREAVFEGADLTETSLREALLYPSNLDKVRGLREEPLDFEFYCLKRGYAETVSGFGTCVSEAGEVLRLDNSVCQDLYGPGYLLGGSRSSVKGAVCVKPL